MEDKLNLYDIFGYLFPGIVLIIIIVSCLVHAGYMDRPASGWSEALLAIPLGYVVGHLVHRIAHLSLPGQHRRRSDLDVAYQLLEPSNSAIPATRRFLAKFKTRLVQIILEKFEIDVELVELVNSATTNREAALERARQSNAAVRRHAIKKANEEYYKQIGRVAENRKMAFDLCYDAVIQAKVGVYTENFIALAGCLRSMMAVVLAGALFYLSLRLWHMSDLRVVTREEWSHFWRDACFTIVTASVLARVFYGGWKRFNERSAISVYRSFYLAALRPLPPGEQPKE